MSKIFEPSIDVELIPESKQELAQLLEEAFLRNVTVNKWTRRLRNTGAALAIAGAARANLVEHYQLATFFVVEGPGLAILGEAARRFTKGSAQCYANSLQEICWESGYAPPASVCLAQQAVQDNAIIEFVGKKLDQSI